MLYEYPAIFHTIEEGYQISFPDFGRSIRADSLPLAMTKASVFLSHIIKGYEDKPYLSRLRLAVFLMRKNSSC